MTYDQIIQAISLKERENRSVEKSWYKVLNGLRKEPQQKLQRWINDRRN